MTATALSAKLTIKCQSLEGELAEARGQRDRLLEEREQWRLSSVCRELVEQRDRLAEALQNVINEDGTPISIDRADEALQSLTSKAKP